LSLTNSKENHSLVAVSTGGGMIEVIEIDGHELSLLGDLFVTLIYFEQNENATVRTLRGILGQKGEIQVLKEPKKEKSFICLKTQAPLDERQIAQAMLAAGMIGVFIAKFSTFAAEVAGCQAECGAGSGMAAAALATLMGAKAEVAVAGASMALQNSLEMICDPVANRVEVPCLGKNVMATSNAVSCANMALAGYDPVIPLDEVVQTMDDVGKSIPAELRCTASGGLSVTPTSQKIKAKLAGNLL
jgi:L-serine deaminase